MAEERVFAVSSPSGDWSPATVTIPADDIQALRNLFAEHHPKNRIAELLASTSALSVMAPITFIVEVEIPDAIEIKPRDAQDLFDIIIGIVGTRLSPIVQAGDTDAGFRVSYYWDPKIKAFSLHVIAPNTYLPAGELYSAMRGVRFTTAPLVGAYIGFMLQDRVLGCSRSIPLYMGPSYTVLLGDAGYTITTARPRSQQRPPSLPGGGSQCGEVAYPQQTGSAAALTGKSDFGSTPVWLMPVEYTVAFFVRMIQRKTHDYDDLCNDVVYTECATMAPGAILEIIGQPPRTGRRERSVRFLYWIAKRVCPDDYKRWMFEQAAIIAHQFSNEAVTDEILQRLFLLTVEGEFMSVNNSSDSHAPPTLYYFKNIWKIDKGMRRLRDTISRRVTTFVGRELKGYMEKIGQMDIYKVMLSEIVRLNYMTTLRHHTVKAVAAMLCEDLYFDEDPNLLGCTNVVIELNDHCAIARPGRPEDLVSMSTNIYFKHYPEEECEDVRTMYRKLFADAELRDWYFLLQCSKLQGINPLRAFFVMFGCARNGKSGQLNLDEIVFGNYFGRFSSKAMCERKDPSATSPELNTFHGKRVVASSELKAGEQMEADILKALTGDDSLSVRGLHKDPRILRMMARIFIASNHFPVFLNADKALRDRTVLIPMESVFDDIGAPKDEFEQYRQGHFPADKEFRQSMQKMAPKLLSMMVDGYATYKTVGLSPLPEKVRMLCEAYWHEVGVQSRFIADCLEFVDAPATRSAVAVPAKACSPKEVVKKRRVAVPASEDEDSDDELHVEDDESRAVDAAIAALAAAKCADASHQAVQHLMTEHVQVVAPSVLPPPPTGGVSAAQEGSARPKLTYTVAYDRFTAWALARQMDVSKYPRFTFKSLMDSELAAMRTHKIEFAADGWVGVKLKQ